MKHLPIFGFIWLGLFLAGNAAADSQYRADRSTPDPPSREFRGAWVTTVHNVDWPSRQGLPKEVQQAELIAILEKCVDLRLNAIVLQVRSECEAIYPSKLEPWSPYLSGTMGKSPGYDPLAFAIAESHKRGLELHAWFNPFRAVNSEYTKVSKDHVSVANKDHMRYYGKKVWLEPTSTWARQRALDVIEDVLNRYDIDGVHIDDYFYPYPIKEKNGKWKEFNDYNNWKAYQDSGGKLEKGDWRRDSMNKFIQELHKLVRRTKPTCKFGISPFGIYRPGEPKQVKNALDAYSTLYSDVKLWWRKGWCDYLAPQLYWSMDHPQYGFPGLYDWWRDENKRMRHLWPGIATYRITTEKRSATESLQQVKVTRERNNLKFGTGHLHFSMKHLMENVSNVNGILKEGAYTEVALIPESPWLATGRMPKAELRVVAETDVSLVLRWKAAPFDDRVKWWLLQTYDEGKWNTLKLVPKDVDNLAHQGFPQKFAITPVGHAGQLGRSAIVAKTGG